MFPPVVGGSSLVGVFDTNYPISFGNYCWINGGPYLINMWAENLAEWSRRNPDVTEIEVTIYSHGKSRVGLVTDSRLKEWCNKEFCVTGHGWPSIEVMDMVESDTGISVGDRCGCEASHESPQISCRYDYPKGEVVVSNFCGRCQRQWEVLRKPLPKVIKSFAPVAIREESGITIANTDSIIKAKFNGEG